jgi:arylsulfatase A-like enzyme
MQPNILWVTIESARADYTSLADDQNSTPFLESLAAKESGRWFSNCFSHGRWTPAASASILTGTRLSTHQVGLEDAATVKKLPTELDTVPDLLGGIGYRTLGISGNPYVSERTDLTRGFDTFYGPVDKSDFLSRTGFSTATKYISKIRTHGSKFSTNPTRHKDCLQELFQSKLFEQWVDDIGDNPFFAYLHLNNVHHPYTPPLALLQDELAGDQLTPNEAIEIASNVTDNRWQVMADGCDITPTQQRAMEATYKAELRYVDYILERLVAYTQAKDRETIVIVTGDHGELFGEANVIGHNLVLHDKILNVPLVTYGLETGQAASTDLVQHADVMKTLLNAVGADTDQFQAVDFTDETREYVVAERGPRPTDMEKLRERNPDADTDQFHIDQLMMIRSKDWKYQRSMDYEELFNIPDERTNLINKHSEKATEMCSAIKTIFSSDEIEIEERERMTADEKTTQRLKDLGYM